VVIHARELLTVADGQRGPRTGERLRSLGIVPDGAVACAGGEIVAVGSTDDVMRNVRLSERAVVLNAAGRVVMPGFVDAHTHLAFMGNREAEFEQRLEGASYEDILKSGGGIHSTVRAVREASDTALLNAARRHMDAMLLSGTTTAEGKSGYGLYLEQEMRLLLVMGEAGRTHPLTVVRTFLAHEIPPDERPPAKRRAYVRMIVESILPSVRETGVARFCDVFCDRGVFTVAESRQILTAAASLGFELKIHADELAASGGALLAAEVGALSADHLCRVTSAGIGALKKAGVIPVLLPGTSFSAGLPHAPARKMINVGLPVAIASDYNPGTNPCESMPMAVALACSLYKLTPAEAIVAATANGAYAAGLGGMVGTLTPGANADLLILDMESYRHLSYHYGVSHVGTVVKAGRVVVDDGRCCYNGGG
jgi:imidazolonepropionase